MCAPVTDKRIGLQRYKTWSVERELEPEIDTRDPLKAEARTWGETPEWRRRTVAIAAWLRSLGLEQYEPAFRGNDIDDDVVPRLTAEDLKDLGVVSVGHRRRLLDAIAELNNSGPEEYRGIIAVFQQACASTIGQFDGLQQTTESGSGTRGLPTRGTLANTEPVRGTCAPALGVTAAPHTCGAAL